MVDAYFNVLTYLSYPVQPFFKSIPLQNFTTE